MKLLFFAAGVLAAMAVCAPVLSAESSPDQIALGARLYQMRCIGCHTIDANSAGPKHRGVVGRKAGTAAGYSYSPALKTSGLTWTEANLDTWLQGPTRMVPGVRMGISVSKPADRAAIIAWLKTQK